MSSFVRQQKQKNQTRVAGSSQCRHIGFRNLDDRKLDDQKVAEFRKLFACKLREFCLQT